MKEVEGMGVYCISFSTMGKQRNEEWILLSM